jgi:hypothetical protein
MVASLRLLIHNLRISPLTSTVDQIPICGFIIIQAPSMRHDSVFRNVPAMVLNHTELAIIVTFERRIAVKLTS